MEDRAQIGIGDIVVTSFRFQFVDSSRYIYQLPFFLVSQKVRLIIFYVSHLCAFNDNAISSGEAVQTVPQSSEAVRPGNLGPLAGNDASLLYFNLAYASDFWNGRRFQLDHSIYCFAWESV